MFAIVKNNQVVNFLPQNTPFKLDGTQYPANYLNLSTPQEKTKLGIVDVVYGQRADDKYYWVSEDAPVVDGNVVKVNYTATPKDFAECQKQAVSAVESQAYSILQPSDYMEIRNLRDPSYKPEWMEWRQKVRDQARIEFMLIQGCETVDQLAALATITWPHDPDYVAPVVDPV